MLFDSLHSESEGVLNQATFRPDASFATGGSSFHATDIALLLNQVGTTYPGDILNVTLVGGIPLSDLMFDPVLGLNVGPGLNGPIVGSAMLPISDLSSNLSVEHFDQFASITLKPNSFYWIDLSISGPATEEGPFVGWSTTADLSGPGVAEGYNSSDDTDFAFFPNGRGVEAPFQMEVSGFAAPEPSTWVLMLAGFSGLGVLAHRRRTALAVAASSA